MNSINDTLQLDDSPVNSGRQKELDLMKAFPVLCLPFVHCIIECSTEEELCYGMRFVLDSIIGSSFSAPMFMFAMGVGLIYSKSATPERVFIRGLQIFGLSYVLNICRFLIPYLIGYMISGDTGQFIDPLWYRVFGNDILQFAGLSLMCIAGFMHIKASPQGMFGISSVMAVCGHLLNDYDAGSPAANVLLGYVIGTSDPAGLVISDFPLLNWMIFPVSGYCFGRILLHARDKRILYLRLSLPCLIISLIYFSIALHYNYGTFGEGQNCYYHMILPDIAGNVLLCTGMMAVWYVVSEYIPDLLMNFLTEVSMNITSVYCVHWVFVRFITNVYLYIRNGTQLLPEWEAYAIAFGILVVTLVITHYWRSYKYKRKASAY